MEAGECDPARLLAETRFAVKKAPPGREGAKGGIKAT
jgi:hypothetical protein